MLHRMPWFFFLTVASFARIQIRQRIESMIHFFSATITLFTILLLYTDFHFFGALSHLSPVPVNLNIGYSSGLTTEKVPGVYDMISLNNFNFKLHYPQISNLMIILVNIIFFLKFIIKPVLSGFDTLCSHKGIYGNESENKQSLNPTATNGAPLQRANQP